MEDCIDFDTKEFKYHKGDLEKVHIHLLIDFYDAHTFSAVKRMFTTVNDNPRCEPVSDRVQCYRYLIHKDNPEKFQYSKSNIVSDNIIYYEKLCVVGEKKIPIILLWKLLTICCLVFLLVYLFKGMAGTSLYI